METLKEKSKNIHLERREIYIVCQTFSDPSHCLGDSPSGGTKRMARFIQRYLWEENGKKTRNRRYHCLQNIRKLFLKNVKKVWIGKMPIHIISQVLSHNQSTLVLGARNITIVFKYSYWIGPFKENLLLNKLFVLLHMILLMHCILIILILCMTDLKKNICEGFHTKECNHTVQIRNIYTIYLILHPMWNSYWNNFDDTAMRLVCYCGTLVGI